MMAGVKEAVWRWPALLRRVAVPVVYPRIHRNLRRARRGAGGEHSLLPFIERRCVYIHVPKVAGVSISAALFGNQSAGHIPMKFLEHALGAEEVCGWYRFTFVRCPWDRVYSAYRYLLSGGMHAEDSRLGERIRRETAGFEDFVLDWLTLERVRRLTHFRRQTWFLESMDGSVRMDFVGRFERLEEDYERLRKRLGFGGELERRNVTPMAGEDLADVYSERAARRIGRLYRRDIEELGYESPF